MLRRGNPRTFLAVAALVSGGALIAGCGGSSSSGSAQTHTVSLARAAYVSSRAAGYRMTMTMHVSGAGQSVDLTASGSFGLSTHEGSMTMLMHGPPASLGNIQMQVVLADNTIYEKLPASIASKIPGNKPWVSISLDQIGKLVNVPGFGSFVSDSENLTNPNQYLDYLRATAAGSIKNLGQATVDGVQTTHYHAQIDFSKLPSVVPAADRHTAEQLVTVLSKRFRVSGTPVDVWLDSSNLVRRLQMNVDETVNGQTVSVATTQDITDYGPQPAPSVPSADQTTNLLSLMHNGSATGG